MKTGFRSRIVLVVCFLLLAGLIPAAAQDGAAQDGVVTITILNTADEHGWLQPFTPFGAQDVQGGAANVAGWWAEIEAIDPDHTLILSSGDNWTGPSISTWFQGEPVVEVFNLMGYDATVIGNHEFDFGREVLDARIAASDFAYLGANIRDAESGDLAAFVQPYIIQEVAGVEIGIIGLTTTDTPQTTHPINIGDLAFVDYAETLETYVPAMREAGADVIVVLAHVCVDELSTLARRDGSLVDAMFGGHCHAYTAAMVDGVSIMDSGWAWRSYARLDISYDPAAEAIIDMEQALVEVAYQGENPVTPDPDVQAIVDGWQAQADEALAQEIGYSAEGLARQSPEMVNWVTDAWLWAYPTAEVAVTNLGGFRQEIPAGPITLSDIVGVLPFENRLYEVAITGAELAANLACCGGAVSGITYRRSGGGVAITFTEGRAFDPDATYRVLISDFMYFGGDGYLFGAQDPDGYDTGIQWRQPAIDWLLANETTPDDPLENYLDFLPRLP